MSVRRISPQEAAAKLSEGYTYLDVRSVPEFEESHPAGAVNVPLLHQGAAGMVPNPDFLAVVRAAFPRDAKLVVGCKAGGRSLRAAEALEADGFTDVIDQRAGFDGARSPFGEVTEPGWSRVDLPVESGAPPGRAYADLAKKSG